MKHWFIGDSVLVRYKDEPGGDVVRVTGFSTSGPEPWRRYRSTYWSAGKPLKSTEWDTIDAAMRCGEIWLPDDTPVDGAAVIARERARQSLEEGYTADHDADHGPVRLIDAALAYTVQGQDKITEAIGCGVGGDGPEKYWPWDLASFRPDDDALRSLAKAGALLAAAYDAELARRAT